MIAFLCVTLCGAAAQLTLSWKDNSDNEDAFSVERSLDGENWEEIVALPADTQKYVDQNLQEGAEYFYRVRAANSFGFSGYTNVAIGIARGSPNDPNAAEVEATPTLILTVKDDGTIDIESANE